MKVLELFAGSRSIGKICDEKGYEVFSTDLHDFEGINYSQDILNYDYSVVPFIPDTIWASPPCTTFSVASMGHHWTGGIGKYKPKTKECRQGLKILEKTIEIIAHYQRINPNMIFYIENPRGVMRKVIDNFFEKYGVVRKRCTVTYCQYGDTRMKPTDIWTNNKKWIPRKMCKNGDPCHESAPRGSRTGTQGKRNAYERSKIPRELCLEVIEKANV